MEVYLDNAATTQVCDEAAAAALEMMTVCYGNPSSSYKPGRVAKAALDTARKSVADALGGQPTEVFFTSGGTEGDNWAIIRGAESMRRSGKHIISSLAEHEAVLKSLSCLELCGYEVTYLSPEADGSITATAVAAALREDTVLVSLMMVSNETGAVTDIAGVSSVLKSAGSRALLHTDAVQGFLKIPFSAKTLGADIITISGHKVHAPKGGGAIWKRSGVRLDAYILGGGQESTLRSGTEGMPNIAALGKAVEIGKAAMEESISKMSGLREHAITRLITEIPQLHIIGGGAPHILSISLPGHRSEVLINYLEGRGIYVSKSSACRKGRRSHVLEAMSLSPDIIDGALRISLSRFTTGSDIDYLCDGLRDASKELLTAKR